MENNFAKLEVGISELAFLMGWEDEGASYYFKKACAWHGLEYRLKMKLRLEQLTSTGEALEKIVAKAQDIHDNYFRRYEGKLKLLNDAKCIETGKWGSTGNARIKVFLKAEDIEKIESIWKTKREQFYSQTSLFGVEPKLFVPKKGNRKKAEKNTQNPN